MLQIHCVSHASTFSKRQRISYQYIDHQHHMKCVPLPRALKIRLLLIKSMVIPTSDNSKYFFWSHRLRVNEFQLYIEIIAKLIGRRKNKIVKNTFFVFEVGKNSISHIPHSSRDAWPTEVYRVVGVGEGVASVGCR